MSDPVTIYHGTVKELIVIQVEIDGAVVTTGYQVCFKPSSTPPLASDPAWQTPDTAGTDTGIFVGSSTANNTLTQGGWYTPWYFLVDTPEQVIKPAKPGVYAY